LGVPPGTFVIVVDPAVTVGFGLTVNIALVTVVPPLLLVVVVPFVVVVAAAIGVGPPTVALAGVPFTIEVAAAVLAVVLHAVGVVNVGPLVLALYVGLPATPSVVTTVLL
jgi:hypothetical protein